MPARPTAANTAEDPSKLSRIRTLIDDFRVPEPDTDDPRVLWFRPARDSPNYFRAVPNTDTAATDEEYYDVWVEAKSSTDRAGVYHLTIEVGIYDGQLDYQQDETTIADLAVGSDQQSTLQTILNNWEAVYTEQAVDKFGEYVEWAEHDLLAARDTSR